MSPQDHDLELLELSEPIDAELLDRYASGRCTEGDAVRVQAFLERHPRQAELLQAMRAAAAGGFVATRRADVAAGWQRVLSLVQQGRHAPAAPSRAGLPRSIWYAASALAAAILLLLVGTRVATVHRGGRGAPGETVYATHNGQRAEITLPDGSTATLNVGSQLRVPVDFATGNRTVHLTGEALFGVIHRRGAPFTVVAGGTTARVLGTSFIVRHYATDTTTIVAVRDGKVAVYSHVLVARQEAVVGRGGVQVGVVDSALFGFASGVLTLDDVPLRDAVVELDRWYDADIRIPKAALATRRIKGTFAGGSLADLSEALSFTFNVRVERTGRVLTLFPR